MSSWSVFKSNDTFLPTSDKKKLCVSSVLLKIILCSRCVIPEVVKHPTWIVLNEFGVKDTEIHDDIGESYGSQLMSGFQSLL